MTSGNLSQNAVREALSRPGYRFAIHGVSTVRGRQQRTHQCSARRSRSRSIPPYIPSDIGDFDLWEFAKPERLQSVFRILRSEGGPGAGTDGITYEDFDSTELYSALRHLRVKLICHEYVPHETRRVRIPKGDGRYRELQLNRILDRVIAKALQLALDVYWRTQLPRLGKDVWDLYAGMQRAMQQSGARFLVVSDVRDCFPSVPIHLVLECHRQHFSHADLLWLIETIVRGHDGPEHTTGLYQGSPYAPVATELLLHTHLCARFGTVFRGSPLLMRYADNLSIVCRSEREGQQALRFCEETLSGIGLSLRPERPPMNAPMDLRRTDPNRKILGLNPSWRNGQLHFAIPETAYHDLRNGFAESIVQPNPVKTALAVATGWLGAMGPTLTNAATPATVDRVISIARECGFNELRPNTLQETCHQANARWRRVSDGRSTQADV